MEEKLQHARDYEQRDLIPWKVAVDDIDGNLHRTLDPKPNAAYLVDVAAVATTLLAIGLAGFAGWTLLSKHSRR